MSEPPSTVDTNIIIHALLRESKAAAATAALGRSTFLSAQALNEYANVASRKLMRSWPEIEGDLDAIKRSVPHILPLNEQANADAVLIAGRYKLSFYDSLMLAVALSGGARTIYSEDMQPGMMIEGALRIVNPFIPASA